VRRSLDDQIAARLPTDIVTKFESDTGFVIYGAGVRRAATPSGVARAELLHSGAPDNPAIIRIWDARPGTSVAVEFLNRHSSILAAIDGYIGHCTLTAAGLSNVSYVPSKEEKDSKERHKRWLRWMDYQSRRRRQSIDNLRAEVAVAADHNSFALASRKKAYRFAEIVRNGKAYDPTLGLYAAYAYAQADNSSQTRSVLKYMRDENPVDLFDVRMLAFRRPPKTALPMVPMCPMLTQGWNLLRARQVQPNVVLTEGAPHLCNSLWTTFKPSFTRQLFAMFKKGLQ
jgi:hypothetical protein